MGTQLVSDMRSLQPNSEPDEFLLRYYGSLWGSVQTLFQSVTGGIDWNEVLTPLTQSISPFLAPVFMLYIAFAVLAMLNIVTGVFVESALISAKADKDICMVSNMRELFTRCDCGLKGKMDWEQFETQLDEPQMQEYFRAIDVDPSEARGVFQLLDIDDSGFITAEEFLSGSIRLRGSAKALDLALLIYNFKVLSQWIQDHAWFVEDQLRVLAATVDGVTASTQASSGVGPPSGAGACLASSGERSFPASGGESNRGSMKLDLPDTTAKQSAAASRRVSRSFSVSGIMAAEQAMMRRSIMNGPSPAAAALSRRSMAVRDDVVGRSESHVRDSSFSARQSALSLQVDADDANA